jgi:hypothetical protein
MSDQVDVLKLRKGAEIVLKDGRKGIVKGCYMSTEGVIVMAKTGGGICDENIPLENIAEVNSGK